MKRITRNRLLTPAEADKYNAVRKQVAAERRPNGQYDHQRMDRECVCGRTLGEHLAAYPHPYEDGDKCPRFRAKRVSGSGPKARP